MKQAINFYRWNPKLAIDKLNDEYSLLLSDTEELILQSGLFNYINQFIDSNCSLLENFKSSLVSSQVPYYQQLATCLKLGYLQEASDDAEFDITPYKRIKFDSAKLSFDAEYINLSHINIVELLPATTLNFLISNHIKLVIVDDYFDTRLEVISDYFKKIKQRWLLVKYSGETSFIGPMFEDTDNSPCWKCLNYRMRANKGLRWLNYQNEFSNKHASRSVPILFDQEKIETAIYLSVDLINRIIRNNITEQFFELNESEVTDHPVIFRPQCEHIKSNIYPVDNQIKLKSVLKTNLNDGGVRSVVPEVTVSKLKVVISPVSGLITHLNCLSSDSIHANKIYRSGFFQNPTNLQHLQSETLSNANFIYTTMGKGISHEQSQASALSETIERLASQYNGDETIYYVKPEKIDPLYILPQDLAPFSASQHLEFLTNNKSEHKLYAAVEYKYETALHWSPVWSLSNKVTRYVPLSYCYANTPFEDQKYCRFYHNGGAAGNTLEEAILQGFLEIVERDAIAIWWYNKLQRPSVNFSSMSDELLHQLQHTLADDWNYWAIDITTDFNIPVIVAVSQHKREDKVCFGFGCHLDALIACQRAFTELCQITEIRDNNTAPFDFDLINKDSYLLPSDQTEMQLFEYQTIIQDDILHDVMLCIDKASKLALETLVLDYTRPDMVLNTAKVIIPGTCHFFPYFAAKRLYQVPVKMGWLDKPKLESELNQQALLI